MWTIRAYGLSVHTRTPLHSPVTHPVRYRSRRAIGICLRVWLLMHECL